MTPDRLLARLLAALVLALVVVLVLAPAPAWADRSARVPGTDLVVALDAGITVRDKTRRAPFVPDPWADRDLMIDVGVSAKGDAVTISVGYNCGGAAAFKTTTQALRARLDNAAALALHGKGRWDEAAAGFARALALDPSFELAALNLASAQARGGHDKDAVATLLTLARRNAPLVIWRRLVDPDLASVANAAELRALEDVPGAGKPATHATAVAYSPSRHLIAWLRAAGDLSGASYDEIRILDAVSGKTLAGLPRSRTGDRSIDQALVELGFVPVPEVGLTTDDASVDPKVKAVFPGTKVGVVLRGGAVTIVTGDHVLGEGEVGWARHYHAALTPDAVLFVREVVVSEGCGGDTYDVAELVPLRGASARAPAP